MRGASGQLTASACHFLDWDSGGIGSPALQIDAGRAVVQACSFGRNKMPVALGSNVISAILTANQAEGGFRFRNLAGRRAQAGFNEENPVEWTPQARAAYRLAIGEPGDGSYLEGWYDPEKAGRPFRWSAGKSRLILPVVPGKSYALRLEVAGPARALGGAVGLYCGGVLIAPFKAAGELAATLPASASDTIEVELRCHSWIPAQTDPGSKDPRALGVQATRLSMRANGSDAPWFDANTGKPTAP
jgi:hypothetical protein